MISITCFSRVRPIGGLLVHVVTEGAGLWINHEVLASVSLYLKRSGKIAAIGSAFYVIL